MPDQTIPHDAAYSWFEWAFRGAILFALGWLMKLRGDVNSLQETAAVCKVSKEEREKLYDERDRQRLEMAQDIKEMKQENSATRDLVQRIAGHLGVID